MWKIYQWLWLRAQKSAAKEIIAYMTAYFSEPNPAYKNSKIPREQKEYIITSEIRVKAMEFANMMAEEFEVTKQPKKLDLLKFRKNADDFEEQLRIHEE